MSMADVEGRHSYRRGTDNDEGRRWEKRAHLRRASPLQKTPERGSAYSSDLLRYRQSVVRLIPRRFAAAV